MILSANNTIYICEEGSENIPIYMSNRNILLILAGLRLRLFEVLELISILPSQTRPDTPHTLVLSLSHSLEVLSNTDLKLIDSQSASPMNRKIDKKFSSHLINFKTWKSNIIFSAPEERRRRRSGGIGLIVSSSLLTPLSSAIGSNPGSVCGAQPACWELGETEISGD